MIYNLIYDTINPEVPSIRLSYLDSYANKSLRKLVDTGDLVAKGSKIYYNKK